MSIDFTSISQSLLRDAKNILTQWYPNGKFRSSEFVVGNINGDPGDSLSINWKSGMWSDFAAGIQGGDLISLYAAKQSVSQGDAARILSNNRPPLLKQTEIEVDQKDRGKPTIVSVVPGHEQNHHCIHYKHGNPVAKWAYYSINGEHIGFIARYDTDGGKVFAPWIYSVNKWVSKQWPEPRPLFNLQTLNGNQKPVLLVEGEKAVMAAEQIAGHVYNVLSWPGGSNAWKKVDLSPLNGRKILLWPDADEPGIRSMLGIADMVQSPEIKIINVEGKVKGWDADDALQTGMTWQMFRDWAAPRAALVRGPNQVAHLNEVMEGKKTETETSDATTLSADSEDKLTKPKKPTIQDGAWQTRPWAKKIITTEQGAAKMLFANAVIAVRSDDKLTGAIGYNNLTMCTAVRKDNGFGFPIGPWRDAYDYVICEWLQKLGIWVSTKIVSDAIEAVSHENDFNPLQDYLTGLVWDGKERISNWLIDFCGSPDCDYTKAIGRKWLIGGAARALQPGCKMDNVLILEGPQGKGKSTLFSILGGEWFTDSIEEMQGKSSAERLCGTWIVELSELDALSRSDIKSVKRFVSCLSDRYRPAYGRRVVDYKRTVIFGGTSNRNDYLRDDENRRFWPVETTSQIDFDKLKNARDQLWAEAVYRFKAGEQWYLSGDIISIVKAQQEQRREEDVWEEYVLRFITDYPRYDYIDGKISWATRSSPLTKVTISQILEQALNIPIGKQHHAQTMRISACIKRMGWIRKRFSDGWAYVLPEEQSDV